MRMYDLILKKREGEELTREEIEFIIEGYVEGNIPDYQMSAWAMAVYFQEMNAQETSHLTRAVVSSGERVDLSSLKGVKVDKHSTGGVGDTTSLVLIPLVAAAGVPVPKMSGRGLGHTGGTLDKLESIPGFKTEMDRENFLQQVTDIGAAIVGQTANLTPADKKLYSLRDVTATVDSVPLIASSIMGKKIAGGADAVVLDVKTGSGAFMRSQQAARELAELMVKIGERLVRKTSALITDMNQPLGRAVGNSLEVAEAIEVLSGRGPEDLRELCLNLAAAMLKAGGYSQSIEDARDRAKTLMDTGRALKKFSEMISAQGGEAGVIEDMSLLPQAEDVYNVNADRSGYVKELEARKIGTAAMHLGAGREKMDDSIDPGAGIKLHAKKGDRVKKGDSIAALHYSDRAALDEARRLVLSSISLGDNPPDEDKIIKDIIR